MTPTQRKSFCSGDLYIKTRQGLTLVELVVVVFVIGILMALVLPAVQSAREASCRIRCQNHLRQIGIACLTHESAQVHYPSDGWGYRWTGDPDRGTGPAQPGGWIYNILPNLGEQAAYVLGQGLPPAEKRLALARQKSHVMALFYCPSRRAAQAYPADEYSYNSAEPEAVAKSDYAINGGTQLFWGEGPKLFCLDTFPSCGWKYPWSKLVDFDGISGIRSQVTLTEVQDGSSHTVLLGEKYLNPLKYHSGDDGSDDGSMYQGHDKDVNRAISRSLLPLQDTPGVDTGSHRFGSAHTAGFSVAMCDGSVRVINYQIDQEVYHGLGTRAGGEPTPTEP